MQSMELSAEHRRFLLVDQGVGPMAINFLLNGVIAWLLFHSTELVPLWGQSSIASDTLATAFILPLATCLIVSRIVAWQVSSGRVPPLSSPATARFVSLLARRPPLHRGAVLGLAAVLLGAVPVIGWFAVGGPDELTLASFLWFKASFAAVLAAIVTPIIGWVALVTCSRASIAAW